MPKVWTLIERILEAVISLALLAMVAVTVFDVAGRYFFGAPLSGGFEISEMVRKAGNQKARVAVHCGCKRDPADRRAAVEMIERTKRREPGRSQQRLRQSARIAVDRLHHIRLLLGHGAFDLRMVRCD